MDKSGAENWESKHNLNVLKDEEMELIICGFLQDA